MSEAGKLAKLIKDLTAITAYLNGRGIRVEVDYQVDDKINTDGYNAWTHAGAFLKSPEDTVFIGAQNIRQMRYRLRLMTDTSTTTPVIKTVVPSGIARGPIKSMWTMLIHTREDQTPAGNIQKPNEMIDWLLEVAESASWLKMTSSSWASMHQKYVVMPPTDINPLTKTRGDRDGKSEVQITLVEL